MNQKEQCDQIFNADLREFDPQVKQVASFVTLGDILAYQDDAAYEELMDNVFPKGDEWDV